MGDTLNASLVSWNLVYFPVAVFTRLLEKDSYGCSDEDRFRDPASEMAASPLVHYADSGARYPPDAPDDSSQRGVPAEPRAGLHDLASNPPRSLDQL